MIAISSCVRNAMRLRTHKYNNREHQLLIVATMDSKRIRIVIIDSEFVRNVKNLSAPYIAQTALHINATTVILYFIKKERGRNIEDRLICHHQK